MNICTANILYMDRLEHGSSYGPIILSSLDSVSHQDPVASCHFPKNDLETSSHHNFGQVLHNLVDDYKASILPLKKKHCNMQLGLSCCIV